MCTVSNKLFSCVICILHPPTSEASTVSLNLLYCTLKSSNNVTFKSLIKLDLLLLYVIYIFVKEFELRVIYI